MDPSLQVHLAQPLQADALGNVDEVPDLHGVPGEERNRLEQGAAARILPGQGLDEA